MPWPAGKPRAGHVAGLTDEHEQELQQLMYQEGVFEGQEGLYKRLVDRLGIANAPARDAVALWLRKQPSAQIARMPVRDKAIAPVLPPARPLSRVFMDTMYMPRAWHRGKVYRLIVVVVDALTKYVHLHAVYQLVDGRPVSTQTREAVRMFIQRARQAMNDPNNSANVHPELLVSDKGSEFTGQQFQNWRAQEEAANPGFYQHTMTPGTRSSFNSIAETTIKTIRRLFSGHYRAVKRDWDERDVPEAQRRYDWVQYLPEIEEIYNTGFRHTIKTTPLKAIDSTQAPSFEELANRIRRKAVKKYGNRALEDGAPIPGFSRAGFLQAGDLVRRKTWKDGGGTPSLQWSNMGKASAGGNYTEQLYRVRAVVPGVGMSVTRYTIEDLNGNQLPGNPKWSRQQLLGPIPQETLALIETDDDDDDDDDEDEDEGKDDDDPPPEPRPVVRDGYRYRVGDVLAFNREWFDPPEAFRDLTPPIARARVGRVQEARVRNFQGAGRLRAYLIEFEDEGRLWFQNVDIDDDDDVSFAGAA